MTTVDGFPIQVCDTGPEKGSVVVLLCAAQRALTAYEAVCERLHTASLRTIVVGPDPRLTPKSVVGILDVLDVTWGVLVGDRDGAELAWELAATRLDRFTGLVVIDRGHPRVADQGEGYRKPLLLATGELGETGGDLGAEAEDVCASHRRPHPGRGERQTIAARVERRWMRRSCSPEPR